MNSKLHKILVLLGVIKSPTMDFEKMLLGDEEIRWN